MAIPVVIIPRHKPMALLALAFDELSVLLVLNCILAKHLKKERVQFFHCWPNSSLHLYLGDCWTTELIDTLYIYIHSSFFLNLLHWFQWFQPRYLSKALRRGLDVTTPISSDPEIERIERNWISEDSCDVVRKTPPRNLQQRNSLTETTPQDCLDLNAGYVEK